MSMTGRCYRARTDGADGRPLEIQLFEWASQEAMDSYMADRRIDSSDATGSGLLATLHIRLLHIPRASTAPPRPLVNTRPSWITAVIHEIGGSRPPVPMKMGLSLDECGSGPERNLRSLDRGSTGSAHNGQKCARSGVEEGRSISSASTATKSAVESVARPRDRVSHRLLGVRRNQREDIDSLTPQPLRRLSSHSAMHPWSPRHIPRSRPPQNPADRFSGRIR
jgi:hypothetical protein